MKKGGGSIKKIILYCLMVVGVFAYESKESLILNTDAKYYKRNEQKPFNGLGLFENEFSYYLGNFKDGMKEGYGENISLGELYIGEFKCGLFEGKGILKSPEGKTLEGIWKRNKFVRYESTGLKEKMKIFSENIIINKGTWKKGTVQLAGSSWGVGNN